MKLESSVTCILGTEKPLGMLVLFLLALRLQILGLFHIFRSVGIRETQSSDL